MPSLRNSHPASPFWHYESVRIWGNVEYCNITEEGVKEIARLEQLKELILGKPSADPEVPAAKTPSAYRTIFSKMKNLVELEMRDPTLQQIDLSRQWVT